MFAVNVLNDYHQPQIILKPKDGIDQYQFFVDGSHFNSFQALLILL